MLPKCWVGRPKWSWIQRESYVTQTLGKVDLRTNGHLSKCLTEMLDSRYELLISSMFVLCVLDIFSTSSDWSDLGKVEDPELKELAELLPTIGLRGKAPSTVKKYSGAFLRWKNWANQKNEVACFPAKPFQVSLYLAYLIQSLKPAHQLRRQLMLYPGYIKSQLWKTQHRTTWSGRY